MCMTCCQDTYVKGHPGNGFIVGNISLLDKLQCQSFVVELESEYGTWWCPGPAHQVVKHVGAGGGVESSEEGEWLLE